MARDKSELIARFAETVDDRVLMARVLDKLSECARKNIASATVFLNERERAMAEKLVRSSGDMQRFAFWGGYEGAERAVMVFLPDYLEEEDAAEYSNVKVLRAQFPKEIKLSHRDFLGALMGAGVKREATGDILVGEGECCIAVLGDIAQFLTQSLESAGRAKLSIREALPEEIVPPEKKVKEVRDTVASMRLDSIVSAGFSMARGKAAELIKSGRVSVNFSECSKSDKEIAQGDVISAKGFGRLEVYEISGTTKKGRTAVVLHRFI